MRRHGEKASTRWRTRGTQGRRGRRGRGLTVTGTLPLGQAVFLPGAAQVTGLGTGVVPGAPATRGHIRTQFLTEAIPLALIGGVIGVLAGAAATA